LAVRVYISLIVLPSADVVTVTVVHVALWLRSGRMSSAWKALGSMASPQT